MKRLGQLICCLVLLIGMIVMLSPSAVAYPTIQSTTFPIRVPAENLNPGYGETKVVVYNNVTQSLTPSGQKLQIKSSTSGDTTSEYPAYTTNLILFYSDQCIPVFKGGTITLPAEMYGHRWSEIRLSNGSYSPGSVTIVNEIPRPYVSIYFDGAVVTTQYGGTFSYLVRQYSNKTIYASGSYYSGIRSAYFKDSVLRLPYRGDFADCTLENTTITGSGGGSFSNSVFKDCEVVVTGMSFSSCTFRNCTFTGTGDAEMSDCDVQNCSFPGGLTMTNGGRLVNCDFNTSHANYKATGGDVTLTNVAIDNCRGIRGLKVTSTYVASDPNNGNWPNGLLPSLRISNVSPVGLYLVGSVEATSTVSVLGTSEGAVRPFEYDVMSDTYIFQQPTTAGYYYSYLCKPTFCWSNYGANLTVNLECAPIKAASLFSVSGGSITNTTITANGGADIKGDVVLTSSAVNVPVGDCSITGGSFVDSPVVVSKKSCILGGTVTFSNSSLTVSEGAINGTAGTNLSFSTSDIIANGNVVINGLRFSGGNITSDTGDITITNASSVSGTKIEATAGVITMGGASKSSSTCSWTQFKSNAAGRDFAISNFNSCYLSSVDPINCTSATFSNIGTITTYGTLNIRSSQDISFTGVNSCTFYIVSFTATDSVSFGSATVNAGSVAISAKRLVAGGNSFSTSSVTTINTPTLCDFTGCKTLSLGHATSGVDSRITTNDLRIGTITNYSLGGAITFATPASTVYTFNGKTINHKGTAAVSLVFTGSVSLENCTLGGSDRNMTIAATGALTVKGNHINDHLVLQGNGTPAALVFQNNVINAHTITVNGSFSSAFISQNKSKSTLTLNGNLSGDEVYQLQANSFGALRGSTTTPIIMDGGTFSGSPALSVQDITIKRGTLNDYDGTNSNYLIDLDSKAEVSTADTKTITIISLANPPIIIDWAEFPGIDLDVDLTAPVIQVSRNPASTVIPAAQVTLTITSYDPDGHGITNCISVNGGSFTSSPTTYTVTDNQEVTILAMDANGNSRQYIVNVTNIDNGAPEVLSITQSNTNWTRGSVKLSVLAKDDIKLNDTPYQYEFTPNSAMRSDGSIDSSRVVTSGWTASKSYTVTENGSLRVRVRDALWDDSSLTAAQRTQHESWSEAFTVSNIDTTAPTLTYTYSVPVGQTVSSAVGVTVQLATYDTPDPVTQDSSGLATSFVMWDSNTQQWSSDMERTFHENGTYMVKVRDAVGNVSPTAIPITISQIATSAPVIQQFVGDHLRAAYVTSPVTLTVTASAGTASGARTIPLASKAYSWDGGQTWTSVATKKVYANGEYTVMVRDEIGSVSEASILVSNIDPYAPTAAVYLYKGAPSDWDYLNDGVPETDDYVWKIRVEASDIGSGVHSIETLWDNGVHTNTNQPIILDVEEPGVYGIIVEDGAGNRTYAEKVVTAESIGQSGGGMGGTNGAYTEIQVPSNGTAGGLFSDSGNSSLQDLVFGPDGVYNSAEGKTFPYPPGQEGIPVNLVVTGKRNNWMSGYATFNGITVPLTFPDASGGEIVKATGRPQNAQAFFPISAITQDAKNARIKVIIQEWTDQTKSTLAREGSATLYTSTQISDPAINYTYNKATDKMTVTATSSVAGIEELWYDTGSGWQPYMDPFTVGSATSVRIHVKDKAGNVTEITLDANDLPLTGTAGGVLPTTDLNEVGAIGADGNLVNSYHISNRAADIYIIGGTRSNTNSIPDGSIYGYAIPTP